MAPLTTRPYLPVCQQACDFYHRMKLPACNYWLIYKRTSKQLPAQIKNCGAPLPCVCSVGQSS